MSNIPTLILGLIIGFSAAAIGFLNVSLDLSKYALSAFLILSSGCLISVVGLALFSYYVRGRLGSGFILFSQTIESIHKAYAGQGASREAAIGELKKTGSSVAKAFFSTIATIRFLGFLFATLTVSVSAAILVATLMQVERLDQQNQLAEASRRAALINELTALLTEIDAEMDQLERKGMKSVHKKKPRAGEGETFVRDGVKISQRLTWRIVALSRSLKPYKFLDGSSLSNKEYSPERAQLLISLVASGIDMKDILRMSSFEYSYMKDVELYNVFLSKSVINYSNFEGANLMISDLSESSARLANFSGANLFMVNMKGADIKGSIFIGSHMPEPHQLSEAKMDGVNLEGALVANSSWLEDIASLKNPPTGFDPSMWTISKNTIEWYFKKQKFGGAYVISRK